MFPVDQLARFEPSYSSYKLLKPWWDILTDYLAAAMLVIALLAGVMQATQDRFVCLPIQVDCNQGTGGNGTSPAGIPNTANSVCNNHNLTVSRSRTVLTKLPDRRQYDFVEAVCGQKEVHPFASYFPFIIFLQAVVLLVIDNFWLRFPVTSSLLEHFVSLVTECFNTPGTSLAVSNTLWGTNIAEDTLERTGDNHRHRSVESVERQPLLGGTQDSTDAGQPFPTAHQGEGTSDSLEVAEAMKAKALYEKMRQFRKDLEPSRCIFVVYLLQAMLQSILSGIFLGLSAGYYNCLRSTLKCNIDYVISENYESFECTHELIPKFQRTLQLYFVPIILYFVASLFVCRWTFSRRKSYNFREKHQNLCCWTFSRRKSYNFREKQQNLSVAYQASADRVDVGDGRYATQDRVDPLDLGDITPASGDFAFVLHLLNAYSTLYSYKFSVFLSRKMKRR